MLSGLYNARMSKCHENAPLKAADLLIAASLKQTPARLAILEVLLNEHGPFSTQEIMEKIPDNLCDQATVFRNLKSLKEKNIITDVVFASDRVHYELYRPNHHHHHIICTSCNKKEPLHQCEISAIKKEANKLGFLVTDHRIELYGLCTQCK